LTRAWRPRGNVEFVVGAGPGGENDRVARGQIIAMNYLTGKRGDADEIGLVSGSVDVEFGLG
jgi:tripartite-type tricarboxylate transporter receptor subunit TctC